MVNFSTFPSPSVNFNLNPFKLTSVPTASVPYLLTSFLTIPSKDEAKKYPPINITNANPPNIYFFIVYPSLVVNIKIMYEYMKYKIRRKSLFIFKIKKEHFNFIREN